MHKGVGAVRRLILPLLLAGALALAGCAARPKAPDSGPVTPPTPAPPPTPGSGGIAHNKIAYEVVPDAQRPRQVQAFLEANLDKARTYDWSDDQWTYVAITAGEKTSGGYEVEIVSVGDSEGRVEVVYRVRGPAPGAIVTAAITYPARVIRFKKLGLPIAVRQA